MIEIRITVWYTIHYETNRLRKKEMIHWSYPLIKDKLIALGETEGFEISLVSSPYRSQRCNSCGHVRKDQRQGELFKCVNCGNATDADLNAALNLELDPPEVPNWVRQQKLNREGFYWTQDGIITSVGHEPIVRDTA